MLIKAIKNDCLILSVWASILFSTSAMAQTVLIDIRNYITQAPPAPICQSDAALCMNGYWDQYGEFVYVYSNGIVDYIARSTNSSATPSYPVGIIRNIPGTGGTLRCFASPNHVCTAPPNSADLPENLPEIFLVNIVPWATEQASENTDNGQPNGTPRTTIAGAVSFNGWQAFDWRDMNYSCQQTRQGTVWNLVTAVYVQSIQFGGDVGTRDALVIDEQEASSYLNPTHIERYFYVNGWGRVREASAWYNANTHQYDAGPFVNSVRNTLSSTLQSRNIIIPTISSPPNYCPQGSAQW